MQKPDQRIWDILGFRIDVLKCLEKKELKEVMTVNEDWFKDGAAVLYQRVHTGQVNELEGAVTDEVSSRIGREYYVAEVRTRLD